jgi:hypothetical protein
VTIIKNPRALTKETNKKLTQPNKNDFAESKSDEIRRDETADDDAKMKKKRELEEMPNFRMAHVATVSVHGPGKISKPQRNAPKAGGTVGDDATPAAAAAEEELNLDLNLFSPDYKPPAKVQPSAGPNKKLASATAKKKAAKKTKDVPLPGKLTPEE